MFSKSDFFFNFIIHSTNPDNTDDIISWIFGNESNGKTRHHVKLYFFMPLRMEIEFFLSMIQQLKLVTIHVTLLKIHYRLLFPKVAIEYS